MHFSVLPRKSGWRILYVSFLERKLIFKSKFKSYWLFYLQTKHIHYGHLYSEAELVVLRRKAVSCVYETIPDSKTQLWEKAFGSWAPLEEEGKEREREREEPWKHSPYKRHRAWRIHGYKSVYTNLGLRKLQSESEMTCPREMLIGWHK